MDIILKDSQTKAPAVEALKTEEEVDKVTNKPSSPDVFSSSPKTEIKEPSVPNVLPIPAISEPFVDKDPLLSTTTPKTSLSSPTKWKWSFSEIENPDLIRPISPILRLRNFLSEDLSGGEHPSLTASSSQATESSSGSCPSEALQGEQGRSNIFAYLFEITDVTKLSNVNSEEPSPSDDFPQGSYSSPSTTIDLLPAKALNHKENSTHSSFSLIDKPLRTVDEESDQRANFHSIEPVKVQVPRSVCGEGQVTPVEPTFLNGFRASPTASEKGDASSPIVAEGQGSDLKEQKESALFLPPFLNDSNFDKNIQGKMSNVLEINDSISKVGDKKELEKTDEATEKARITTDESKTSKNGQEKVGAANKVEEIMPKLNLEEIKREILLQKDFAEERKLEQNWIIKPDENKPLLIDESQNEQILKLKKQKFLITKSEGDKILIEPVVTEPKIEAKTLAEAGLIEEFLEKPLSVEQKSAAKEPIVEEKEPTELEGKKDTLKNLPLMQEKEVKIQSKEEIIQSFKPTIDSFLKNIVLQVSKNELKDGDEISIKSTTSLTNQETTKSESGVEEKYLVQAILSSGTSEQIEKRKNSEKNELLLESDEYIGNEKCFELSKIASRIPLEIPEELKSYCVSKYFDVERSDSSICPSKKDSATKQKELSDPNQDNSEDNAIEVARRKLWAGVKSLSLDAEILIATNKSNRCYLDFSAASLPILDESPLGENGEEQKKDTIVKNSADSVSPARKKLGKRRNSEAALQLMKENTKIIDQILNQRYEDEETGLINQNEIQSGRDSPLLLKRKSFSDQSISESLSAEVDETKVESWLRTKEGELSKDEKVAPVEKNSNLSLTKTDIKKSTSDLNIAESSHSLNSSGLKENSSINFVDTFPSGHFVTLGQSSFTSKNKNTLSSEGENESKDKNRQTLKTKDQLYSNQKIVPFSKLSKLSPKTLPSSSSISIEKSVSYELPNAHSKEISQINSSLCQTSSEESKLDCLMTKCPPIEKRSPPFYPFPTKPLNRPPKEAALKLGLYSSNNKPHGDSSS